MFSFNRKNAAKKNQTQKHSMLMETLESRQLMTGNGFSATIVPQGVGPDMLMIYGQVGASETISVYQGYSSLSVYDNGQYEGSFNVGSVAVFGRRGDKMIDIDLSVTVPVIIGTGAGNDTVLGGSGYNYIADRRFGNSLLVSNSSDTTLIGSKGNDTLVALQGDHDTLVGGIGTDSFWVNANGNDTIQSNNPGEWIHYINHFQSYATRASSGLVWTTTPGMGRNPGTFAEPGTNGQIQDTADWQNIGYLPLFASTGPVAEDINQHELGDCYFLSTLASIAGVDPNILRQNITSLGDGTFAVTFTINGQAEFFRVDGNVPIGSSGDLEYEGLGTENSIWAAIYEKAFAEARPSSNGLADYGNIEGGYASEAFADFNASDIETVTPNQFANGFALLSWILQQQQQGKAVELGTNPEDPALGANPDFNGLIGGHAYTVVGLDVDAFGNEYLMVRNPWGNAGVNSDTDGYVDVPVLTMMYSIQNIQSARI